MSDYTSGPWSVVLRGERGTFHIPEAQADEAAQSAKGDGYTVSHANARLIAAAPDMLAALELARDSMSAAGVRGGLDDVIAAIAKATGSPLKTAERTP